GCLHCCRNRHGSSETLISRTPANEEFATTEITERHDLADARAFAEQLCKVLEIPQPFCGRTERMHQHDRLRREELLCNDDRRNSSMQQLIPDVVSHICQVQTLKDVCESNSASFALDRLPLAYGWPERFVNFAFHHHRDEFVPIRC